jgi:hypothetical protein
MSSLFEFNLVDYLTLIVFAIAIHGFFRSPVRRYNWLGFSPKVLVAVYALKTNSFLLIKQSIDKAKQSRHGGGSQQEELWRFPKTTIHSTIEVAVVKTLKYLDIPEHRTSMALSMPVGKVRYKEKTKRISQASDFLKTVALKDSKFNKSTIDSTRLFHFHGIGFILCLINVQEELDINPKNFGFGVEEARFFTLESTAQQLIKGIGFFQDEDIDGQSKVANTIVSALIQHSLQMQKLWLKRRENIS